MTGDGRDLPVLRVPWAQAKTLRDALHSMEIDDASLAETAYQSLILSRVAEAAGSAFDDLAKWVRERLLTAPWCAMIRGLPSEQATQILVSLSASLGELVEPYRQPWSRVIRHVVPSRDRTVDGRVLNEFLHTDGTDWSRPNDYTCLFCVRPDQRGDGTSRLLDLDTLVNEMSAKVHATLLRRLTDQSVPWRIAEELGGGVHWAPVLQPAPRRIRWLHYTVLLSCQDGLASL